MEQEKPHQKFAKDFINWYGIAFIICAIFLYVVYHTADANSLLVIQQGLTYTELFDLFVWLTIALGLLFIAKPLSMGIGNLLMTNDYFRQKYIERLKRK